MSELVFPKGFLWGTATAAHQVEGDNSNSDWWDWELKEGTPCKEPSGAAIEHYERYPRDIALLAGLGFNTYRFSVEWARVEPEKGRFDEKQLDHYRGMVVACRKSKLNPMVTLNHFTLPRWVAAQGGWLSEETPALFERYTRRVVEALGDEVGWYCTINEPGVVAFGGYMGGLPFPPGLRGLRNWRTATQLLIAGHQKSRAVIKELRPAAQVGVTVAMSEYEWNAGGRPAAEFSRYMGEDVYLAASKEDDFIGVQTYTRNLVELPRIVGWLNRAVFKVDALKVWSVDRSLSRATLIEGQHPEFRRTQMDWEYRPQAVVATVRRVAEFLPGKPIVVTENGIATANDEERIEFVRDALAGLHEAIGDGVPLKGYIHWSGFDNFEWHHGYGMTFGLIGVDRKTQARTAKPSAKWLGEVAKTNKLVVP